MKGKRSVLIVLLVLPYLAVGGWLASQARPHKYPVRVHHLERQWLAQFRQQSPDLQDFYMAMPSVSESWSRKGLDDVFRYSISARVSEDLMLKVSQTFEITDAGVRPADGPVCEHVTIYSESSSGTSRRFSMSKEKLELAEFRAMYLKYAIDLPGQSGSDGTTSAVRVTHAINDHPETLMRPPLAAPETWPISKEENGAGGRSD
jgi:hypothetical protein